MVITTYDRVRTEYKKNYSSQATTSDEAPLFDVEWHRVVLDESHKVRGGTMLFQSVNALKSKYRWCLSGTPFQVKKKLLTQIYRSIRPTNIPLHRMMLQNCILFSPFSRSVWILKRDANTTI